MSAAVNSEISAYDSWRIGLVQKAKAWPLPHAAKFAIYRMIRQRPLVLKSHLAISDVEVELNVADFVQYWMFVNGLYEAAWVKLVSNRVGTGAFFDVGANVGNYSLALCKTAPKIYAFEASELISNQLKKALRQNNIQNVEVVRAAISDHSGDTLEFFVDQSSLGNSNTFQNFSDKVRKESVQTLALDEFCAQNATGPVSVMKMDIEGAELSALRGALQMIRRWKPDLVIEFNAGLARRLGQDLFEIWNLLIGEGYRAFDLKNDRLVPFELPHRHPRMNRNLLFVHQAKA